MPGFKRDRKKIACIEGDWDRWQDRSSVKPIVDVVQDLYDVGVTYRKCNTVEEFTHNMNALARLHSYELIYLAFHGVPGGLESTGPFAVTLEQLAEIMGTDFRGRAVHMGSCSTLRVSEKRLQAFMEQTGVSVLSGFTKDINWVEATAFDFILLNAWQNYKRPAFLKKHMFSTYGELVDRLGFEMYIA